MKVICHHCNTLNHVLAIAPAAAQLCVVCHEQLQLDAQARSHQCCGQGQGHGHGHDHEHHHEHQHDHAAHGCCGGRHQHGDSQAAQGECGRGRRCSEEPGSSLGLHEL